MLQKPVLCPQPRRAQWKLDALSRDVVVASRVDASIKPQGYRLELAANGVTIIGSDDAGVFYARQTIAQLRTQFGDSLPQGMIEDWPDFAVRGVMLDISRDKVPTMATLYGMVDLFASLKINQLQL